MAFIAWPDAIKFGRTCLKAHRYSIVDCLTRWEHSYRADLYIGSLTKGRRGILLMLPFTRLVPFGARPAFRSTSFDCAVLSLRLSAMSYRA